MQWYAKVFKNYANFSGRARRKEYWMFTLINAVIMFVFYILFFILAAITAVSSSGDSGSISTGLSLLASLPIIVMSLYGLAILLPSLAVTVRRLHDQGKSGVWYFISFVPFIGGIWLLVLMCMEGTMGANQYGDDPKSGEIFQPAATTQQF